MKLIQTKDYLLLIDEEAEIKVDDYCVNLDSRISHLPIKVDRRNIGGYGSDKYYWSHKKIIAYYPLTKEAKELDLPVLPNPFEEVNIEKLALDWFVKANKRDIIFDLGWAKIFEAGYKAAQSKQFSLEDMKKAFEYYAFTSISNQPYNDTELEEQFKEFIQSLSTKQLPKEFIPEMRKISKYSYRDNYGKECFTFKGLLKGDVIISTKNQKGIGGDFIPFPMTLIKENKEYKVEEISSFEFYRVPWVIDEDGNHTIPDFDLFKVKKHNELKIITNSEGKEELVGTYKY